MNAASKTCPGGMGDSSLDSVPVKQGEALRETPATQQGSVRCHPTSVEVEADTPWDSLCTWCRLIVRLQLQVETVSKDKVKSDRGRDLMLTRS